MKLYKFVSYASLVVILFLALAFGSLFFRFPVSDIGWKPAIFFSTPALVLVALLFLKPRCSQKIFRVVILSLAGFSILATIFAWMAPIVLGVFLAAIFALYFA